MSEASFPHRDLVGIAPLSAKDIELVLDRAEKWAAFNRGQRRRGDRLAGITQINAFFEPSTRTMISFELAGKRLGADVVALQATGSSMAKGESLIDTVRTLDAMGPDILVVRHGRTGAADEIAGAVNAAVVNAGDGTGEHPTQALLDALAIRRHFGRIAGLTVAICGDIAHSRVARSNLLALGKLGVKLRAVGPQALLPEDGDDIALFTDMDEGIAGADVVMMLRIQRERMDDALAGKLEDYRARYGLSRERLRRVAPDAVVMHPGPMNRGVEIESAVADDAERSLILKQVELGVAVRMACLDLLAGGG
ncbi:MAG: aspartate carbamoyltransferase catalytic subunit [Sphingomonadaceae bacterium]